MHVAKEVVRKRYSSTPISEEQVEKAASFITYVSYRGTEYYKILLLIKAKSEEEVVMEEGKILEYAGTQGLMNWSTPRRYGKCW